MFADTCISLTKYSSTALLLKLFSCAPGLYRLVGNRLGQKKRIRAGIPAAYGERARNFLQLCERHHAVDSGDTVLEIGTGWVHFESMVLRLFYDVRATLFDVWDNRQHAALKTFCMQLEAVLSQKLVLNDDVRRRIKTILAIIIQAESFDDLYHSLDFRYVINPQGSLDQFSSGTFQMVYSCNVLEHVDRQEAPEFINSLYRILKPGGFSIHRIDFSDHLVSFAGVRGLSRKNYLRYSDPVWKALFQNRVQYINRMQRPAWLGLFEAAGFELLEEQVALCDIETIKINKMYADVEKDDLACEAIVVVHRKPY